MEKKEKERLINEASKFKRKALALSTYLRSGIHTDDELTSFLKHGLGISIPKKINCEQNHTSPFQFLSDIFLGRVEDAIGYANRSGGKSFLAGLLTFLRSIWRSASTRILGGSLDQSDKSYQSFAGCWDISGLGHDLLKTDIQKQKTDLKNGARVEILTASQRSVRGPHQPNLILDEIEEMEWDIYQAALSQPQSTKIASSSTIILSTMHKADGIMNFLIKNHKAMHLKLYAWCIWEALESCLEYSCSRCPLSNICPGKHMKKADGFYTIPDLLKKMYHLDEEVFETEWLCKKPSRRHLVYDKFNENIHVIDCNYNPSYPVSASIDWGGVNPFAVLIWQQIQGRGDVIVDEVYQGNTDNLSIIELCKSKPWWQALQNRPAYCDPARQDLISEWTSAGVAATSRKSTIDDINLVRTKLAPMRGEPTLYVNKKCKMTIDEFNSYKRDKDGNPISKNDHSMAAARYYVRGTKISSGERPKVFLGMRRSLMRVPLIQRPLWKDEMI